MIVLNKKDWNNIIAKVQGMLDKAYCTVGRRENWDTAIKIVKLFATPEIVNCPHCNQNAIKIDNPNYERKCTKCSHHFNVGCL